MYTCPFHTIDLPKGQPCPQCLDAYAHLPHPDEMTGEERAHELAGWQICTIDFFLVHQRITALVGPPVLTHEIRRSSWPLLLDEARTHDHPHPLATLQSLVDQGVRVIPLVIADDAQ